MSLLDVVVVICVGLLIGTEFSVSVFVNPVLRKLEDHIQGRLISLFAARLGRAMPFWYLLSLLLLILEAIIRHREPAVRLILAASIIWVLVIIFTVLVLVPINNRMMRLDPGSFPEKAQQEHKRWERFHRLRVAALTAALVCFLLAL
jgi:uncharacterized membrane protein